MLFIETPVFTRLLPDYLNDDEYWALQVHLMNHPQSGDIIRGSGGIRKMRWNSRTRGKSGGYRIIYYWKPTTDEIWLLTIYNKSEREVIHSHVLKKLQRRFRMSVRNIGTEILEGISDIQAFKKGQNSLKTRQLTMPSEPKVIRTRMKLSQSAFASLLGVSTRTLQDWEQGRRVPQGPAIALLRIAEQHPDVFNNLY